MSTPGGAVAPYPSSPPPAPPEPPAPLVPVIDPTAMAGPMPSAIFALGEVLKTIIHGIPTAFHSENLTDDAINVINAFVRAFVSPVEMPALLTGTERAGKEDVTQRIPPAGTAIYAGPVLDYGMLARAILAEQRRQAQGEITQ